MDNKEYVWKLSCFLHENGTKMSGDELAGHLNRNGLTTRYGSQYAGKRGTYTLIKATYSWLEKERGLPLEAKKVAEVFVLPTGEVAY